ncbi:hypothetical protein [Oceanicola sp. S124]|uniref:hypothetical protein n=1 Tax=Oceanicola sp. S124 TaxID=1042378 RepID=UPI000255A406|nr:hypothetical protein [Oceanicola sp. S124]
MTRPATLPALLLALLPLVAVAQDVAWIDDPAYCAASIAAWEEREPMVLERHHMGNHYMGCDWAARLPDLEPGQRFTIPQASCADNQAMPRSRFWTTEIRGAFSRDGRITLRIPGFRPARVTFRRCPGVGW